LLHVDATDGEFHIKTGGFTSPKAHFGLKANAGFFGNTERNGLPTIQGLILLYDAENGYPLAVMDSGFITIQRTGAATAVAATYLARPDSTVATICGAGTQGHVQLRALAHVLPLEKAYAWDTDVARAEQFAGEMGDELGFSVESTTQLASAVGESDICVTCTPSRSQFLKRGFVRPGTFVAAVGADSPGKQELDPRILGENVVVVDLLEQCVSVGALQHAIRRGLMTPESVRGELGEIVAGKVSGRETDAEIIVFDSTGTALQDTAAAVLVYQRAISAGTGRYLDFAAT
jgi:ornithine cyclodeaminase/alanine dehydrogenase